MSDQNNAVYAFTLEAARHPIYGTIDPTLLEPLGFMVPKNSGIQIVHSSIEYALARAKRFKGAFREFAIEMVMADKKGERSISAEGGAYIKEFGTTRSSVPLGSITGPPVTDADVYLHEQLLGDKGKFDNNPRSKKLWDVKI